MGQPRFVDAHKTANRNVKYLMAKKWKKSKESNW